MKLPQQQRDGGKLSQQQRDGGKLPQQQQSGGKKLFSGLQNWGKDVILKKVISNSAYLFASQAVSAILSILAANLLGVASFG
jgi:hypothetical protein